MSTPEDLAKTVKEFEAVGSIYAAEVDVRDSGALAAALDEGAARFGGVDIVLANADIARTGQAGAATAPVPLNRAFSLRAEGSRSRTLSARYAERWKAKNPGGTVTYRDLAGDPVPHMDITVVSAQHTAPADRTPEQAAAQFLSDTLFGEVMGAETILIGMPLCNFGPRSTFKAWFDRIVSEQTLGKLSDKTFVVVTARGGGYSLGTPRECWDHREPWLAHGFRVGQQAGGGGGADFPEGVESELERVFRHR